MIPTALQWIRSQSAKKAIVIGVCVGAKVVGDAGLLHGKRATTHWYSIKEIAREASDDALCRRPPAGGR